jgi:nesprin-1
MASMAGESNQTRLETAFYVAEVELGVTRLLDPEDVDVPNPDEKSVMTYVAQFLHKYPEGSKGAPGQERFGTIESQFQELREWLTANIAWFQQGKAPTMDYGEYLKFGMDVAAKREIYDRLRQLQETNRNVGIDPEDWREVDNNWQKVEAQVSSSSSIAQVFETLSFWKLDSKVHIGIHIN